MSPNQIRMFGQAAVLFVVCPIGLLGAAAFATDANNRNIPLAAFMAVVGLAGLALAVWRVSVAMRSRD